MTFDLGKILQSKREFRRRLAAKPIAEKLALLDVLRERILAIRAGVTHPGTAAERPKAAPMPCRSNILGSTEFPFSWPAFYCIDSVKRKFP